MKTSIMGFLLITAVLSTQQSRAAILLPQNESQEAVNMFYTDLTPYGQWIEFQPGYYAWQPTLVDPGWRPYTRGHWVWSNYGWYWVSAEPFGWATYHYGRWYYDDFYGWLWIPGTIWGPAWVEWRYNDSYVGWAPLPPYAHFHITVGIRFTRRWAAPPTYWSFIAYDHFASGHPYHTYVPESYVRRLISTTRATGRYQIDQNRIIDQGDDRSIIERRAATRIGTTQVTEVPQRGIDRVVTDGSHARVEIYRPRPGDSRIGSAGIVARKADRRSSFDFERSNGSQAAPQRSRTPSRLNGQVPQRGFEPQGQRPQQARPNESPEINRDRFMRSRPQFPAPKVDRAVPKRPAERKDQGRSRRRRDGF